MKTLNDRTVESYNGHAQQYIENTPSELSAGLKAWYRTVFENIPLSARIFEIGSASGRDALFIESLGYSVTRTDATEAFITILRESGVEATHFNAIRDEFPSNLDIVIANAVLLHFSRQEALDVMRKVYAALTSDGTFALTLMKGVGDHVSDVRDAKIGAPRYFHFWSELDIENALREVGFRSVIVERAKQGAWLNVIARK